MVETTGGSSTAYLYGHDLMGEEGTAWAWHLNDGLGSVRQLADGDGDVTLAQGYTPFGVLLWREGDAASGYGYTGEQEDVAVGLVFLRARYYDPYLNRFISPDTIIPDFTNPPSLNRYVYVYNNAVNLVDPSGHQGWDCAGGPCITTGAARPSKGAYKRAFGVHGYPTSRGWVKAFEAGYNPFRDPDYFVRSDDGTVLVRGGSQDVYFQEYYHWAYDTGGWLPLHEDLRHDVFAYWTAVQTGRGIYTPDYSTSWRDITAQGFGVCVVFAAEMVADLLNGRGAGTGIYSTYVVRNADGKVIYVGRTLQSLSKRQQQHRRIPRRGDWVLEVDYSGLTKDQAQGREQILYETFKESGLLENIDRPLSPRNSRYEAIYEAGLAVGGPR